MKKYDVSVIVPVYGVERYVGQCVRSLMEQTLGNVEYIFVDDCTPDDSIRILEAVLAEYPERGDGVKIIHNDENLGQAASRRRGIEMAQGDYVIHCDSDDWVDRRWLEKLYVKALERNADIVWSGFDSVLPNGETKFFSNYSEDTLGDFLTKMEIGDKWGSLCLHLVRRDIVQSEKIEWPDWNYCEDLALLFQYASMAETVAYVEGGLYKYRHNTGSITSRRTREGVMGNVEGEIKASLVGMRLFGGLGACHKANLLKRVYRAKMRLMIVADSPADFCGMWHMCGDGLSFGDIWRSSLGRNEKLLNSLIYLNLYPLVKRIV